MITSRFRRLKFKSIKRTPRVVRKNKGDLNCINEGLPPKKHELGSYVKDILPQTDQELADEKDQKVRMESYKVGALDSAGHVIGKIFARGDNYLIYEIEGAQDSESFRTLVDTVINSDPNGYLQRFEEVKPSINDFRAILHKGVHDKSVKHRAASAISTALRGNVAAARVIFANIKNEVEAEHTTISNGRINYLGSAFVTVLILAILAGYFYVERNSKFFMENPVIKYIGYSMCFSSLGGFLSICINLKDTEFERSIGEWKYRIYGVQRIILASTCGVVTYILVASGFLFSFLMKSPEATFALTVICVLAGFSEKLIPNALGRLETKDD